MMIKLFNRLLLLFLLWSSFACSTGADPEDVVLDIFTVPAKGSLQIQNIFNELAMDVNGIVMNNLDFAEDTITKDVADCLDALVYRDSESSDLDSIVLDYKSSYCRSNGGRFKGKTVIEPKDQTLKVFEISLVDFFGNGYGFTGDIEFQVVGDIPGKDFSVSLSNAEFLIEDTEFAFSIPSINGSYTFVGNEEDDDDYVDDIFNFTVDLEGFTPDGVPFTFNSSSDLTYTYVCGEIIGGNADFVLSDIGEGAVDFGNGDPTEDCDNDVTIQTMGATINVKL